MKISYGRFRYCAKIKWNKLIILLLGSVSFLISIQATEKVLRGKEILIKKRTVNIEAERIDKIADVLSKTFSIPVCVEEARWFPRKEDSPELQKILEKRQVRKIVVSVKEKSLASILDTFVANYPEYQWRLDEEENVINIFPKDGGVADWEIENLNIREESFENIAFKNDFLNLKTHGVDNLFGGNMSWSREKCITLQSNQILVRNGLNKICNQFHKRKYWSILECKDVGVSWTSGEKVMWYLIWKPYLQVEPTPEILEFLKARGKDVKDLPARYE